MFQNKLIELATGGTFDEELYLKLRKEFMEESRLKTLLPGFIRKYRSVDALWDYFKSVSPHWQPRRVYIRDHFSRLLDYLEENNKTPSDKVISITLESFDPEGVHRAWQKALERRQSDPEGAITSARTLLETVCKRILEDVGISYGERDDLPKLYKEVAKHLTLGPSQHSEEVIKTILGNCQSVVNNLGSLRNKIGDAHGQGRRLIRPGVRHATLAVNLAGTVATFLVETFHDRLHTKKAA